MNIYNHKHKNISHYITKIKENTDRLNTVQDSAGVFLPLLNDTKELISQAEKFLNSSCFVIVEI